MTSQIKKMRAICDIPDKTGVPLDKISLIVEQFRKLAGDKQFSYVIYTFDGQTLLKYFEDDVRYGIHVILCLIDEHYYILKNEPPRKQVQKLLAVAADTQIAMTDKVEEDSDRKCDKVYVKGQQLEKTEFERTVVYKKTLIDPTLDDVLEQIHENNHIFITGGAGVGKSWMLNQISERIQCTKTASTGVASTLINGSTIHYHIGKKFREVYKYVIIDEISMIGSAMFDTIIDLADKKDVRLIICGDVLQLPPVNDTFFFKSSDYCDFAKNCVKVQLTIVKRQKIQEQSEFLNKLRVGDLDKTYIRNMMSNVVSEPDIVILPTNKMVKAVNDKALEGKIMIEYIVTIKNEDIECAQLDAKQYKTVSLCDGCKVMCTSNIDVENGIVNGVIGYIQELSSDHVIVNFKQIGLKKINYRIEKTENGSTVRFMPLIVAYAITIHKSQGQTYKSAHISLEGLFERSQAYVAISRVSNLNDCQIISNLFSYGVGFEPNGDALMFERENMINRSQDDMLVKYTAKQLKNVKRKTWRPLEEYQNNIYFDFETRMDGSVQVPYYNKILHIRGDKTVFEQTYFDQLWNGGIRCDVAEETWLYIRKTFKSYGNNLKHIRDQGKSAKKLFEYEKRFIPTLVAFNGSGFDFMWIFKRFIKDESLSKRFRIQNVFKGSRLIFLSIFDRKAGHCVLKTWDPLEITGCSLKQSLLNFCSDNKEAQQIAQKIEFHDEIVFIMYNYSDQPEILKPGVISDISKKIWQNGESNQLSLDKQMCLYDSVIKYADNDVDVLPVLVQCLDVLTKTQLNASVMNFLTAGSMSWYGFLLNLPIEAIQKAKDQNKHVLPIINTRLYHCEDKEQQFIAKSVKGGRVLPRIHRITKDQNMKCGYLDISGMYVSIMVNERFSYGKSRFIDDEEKKIMMSTLQKYKRCGSWRKIFDDLTTAFGLFVIECEFEENKHNLEPVVQFKRDGKTIWTVERRTDTITSVDLAMIIESGGCVHQVIRVITWEHNGNIMKQWMLKTLEIKDQGERDGNSGMKTFGKLLGNSTYGQTCMQTHKSSTQFAACKEEVEKFLQNHIWEQCFDVGGYTVLGGKKIIKEAEFISNRCLFIGSFVLAYARALIFEIVEVACPNRYNKKGIKEQAIYGDTDSLIFQDWQCERLIRAGWIKKENGRLTDELSDTNKHWFIPSRLQYITEDGTKTAVQQQEIWKLATQEEKCDPANFRLRYVNEYIGAAPKSYAVRYIENNGTPCGEKLRFKGIPRTAVLIQDKATHKLSFDSIQKSL